MASRLLMLLLLFSVGVTCTFAQLGEIVDEYANGELFDQLFRQIRQQTDNVILVPTGGDANVTSPNVTAPNVTIPSASPSLAPSAAAPSTPPSSQLSVTGLPGIIATCKYLSLTLSSHINAHTKTSSSHIQQAKTQNMFSWCVTRCY